MTEPVQEHRGINTPLLVAICVVGLIFLLLGTRGCFYRTFGLWPSFDHWWHGWSFNPFGSFSGMFSIWGVIQLGLAIWVGVDANRRGLSGLLWGLLVFFTSIIGLIVYLIVAPTLESQRNGGGSTAATPVVPIEPRGPVGFTGACASCGGEIRPEFKVCPGCGAEAAVRCASCARDLQAGWKVCPYCGTPTEAGGGYQPST